MKVNHSNKGILYQKQGTQIFIVIAPDPVSKFTIHLIIGSRTDSCSKIQKDTLICRNKCLSSKDAVWYFITLTHV
jgi:hypothetical protein